MSQLPPAKQSPQTPAPAVEPGFEIALQEFWDKNQKTIFLICALALLAIIGREGWQYVAASREQGVQEEYAKLADQPAKLAAFAEANSSHPLAGVAWLRLADEKYTAADYKTAAAHYQKATGSLKNEILLGRAKLGAAMSQINGGDTATGTAALKAIGADAKLPANVRAEATYQLAVLAVGGGNADEVKKLADEVSKIDPSSAWSQRAALLVVGPASAGKPVEAAADTGISFKPAGKP